MDENFNISLTKNQTFELINSTAECHLPYGMALSMLVINIFVSLLGTTGNLLVCFAVLTTLHLQRISNYFICCLAVADLTITAADQPLLAVMLWGRMYGDCFPRVELAFRFIGNVSCAASLLTLCFISVDRCVSIVKPFSYPTIITRTRFLIMVTTAWVFSIVYTFLRIFVSKKITSYVTVGMFPAGYGVFATCYLLIIFKIRKQAQERANLVAAGGQSQALQASQAIERRLAVTVAVIMFVFSVAWMPLFYLRVKSPKKNFGVLYDWARTIALSSSAVNPALYCMRNEEYRKAFVKLIRFIFCCRRGGSVHAMAEPATSRTQPSQVKVA